MRTRAQDNADCLLLLYLGKTGGNESSSGHKYERYKAEHRENLHTYWEKDFKLLFCEVLIAHSEVFAGQGWVVLGNEINNSSDNNHVYMGSCS